MNIVIFLICVPNSAWTLDSLGMVHHERVTSIISCFLSFVTKKTISLASKPLKVYKLSLFRNQYKHNNYFMNIIYRYLRILFRSEILQVAEQRGGYDCGIHVLHNLELTIKVKPHMLFSIYRQLCISSIYYSWQINLKPWKK